MFINSIYLSAVAEKLGETATIDECPCCSSRKHSELFLFESKIPIRLCNTCGAEFCAQRYTDQDLAEFYSSSYFRGEYGYKDYTSLERMKSATFLARLRRLERLCPKRGTLLDVGCASGLLVGLALQRGWNAYGIDVSRDAVESSEPAVRPRLTAGAFLDMTGERTYDVITMSDLIEHVHTPHEYLAKAHSLLKPGGLLFIETPNTGGMMRKVMGPGWPMYKPPEHLVYFNRKNLSDLLDYSKFTTLSAKPSWKCLTLSYVLEKMSLTHPGIVKAMKPLTSLIGEMRVWIPAGSFWLIAKRNP